MISFVSKIAFHNCQMTQWKINALISVTNLNYVFMALLNVGG